MAPTTMPNQVTSTCPMGRDVTQAGYPLRVAELLSSLKTDSFIARVGIYSPKCVVQAKKIIKARLSTNR